MNRILELLCNNAQLLLYYVMNINEPLKLNGIVNRQLAYIYVY